MKEIHLFALVALLLYIPRVVCWRDGACMGSLWQRWRNNPLTHICDLLF